MKDVKVISDAGVLCVDGLIEWAGEMKNAPGYSKKADSVIDANGKGVVPGFIDSHTHFIFDGYREDEFSWRMEGVPYMEIHARGGGIGKSVEYTRKASLEKLVSTGKERLDTMLTLGITTVEGKSGYGLDMETEIRQLEAMKKLDEIHEMDIVPTFMGAHSIPKEYKGRTGEYIDFIIEKVLPEVVDRKLADFCDVFCEKNVFEIGDSRRLLEKAKEYGLGIKLHADEIVRIGGTELGAELGAASADHLLKASNEGIKALAQAGTVATVLPLTAFSLKEPYANARGMIDEGCIVSMASDFNPGSCFSQSIPLAFAIGSCYMGLSPEETLNAFTINAAKAVGREKSIGSIETGKKADLAILKYPSYKFLAYAVGMNCVSVTVKNGKTVWSDGLISAGEKRT